MGVRITAFEFELDSIGTIVRELRMSSSKPTGMELLRALRKVAVDDDRIRLVSHGHRRWWIGSFIASCRREPSFGAAVLSEMERLFSRILRDHDCGVRLASVPYSLKDVVLPCALGDDADRRLATLDGAERTFFAEFIVARLSEEWRVFACPDGAVGIAPDAGPEWDQWTRDVASEFATSTVAQPAGFATFIG